MKLTTTFMANTIKSFPVQAKVILKNKTKGNVIIVIYPIDYEFRLSSFNFNFNDMDEGIFFLSLKGFSFYRMKIHILEDMHTIHIENYYKYKMSFSRDRI